MSAWTVYSDDPKLVIWKLTEEEFAILDSVFIDPNSSGPVYDDLKRQADDISKRLEAQ